MLRALYSSASGMESQQLNLDVIANNLANVDTPGFKKSKIEFQDMLYETTRPPGAQQGSGDTIPTGLQIGHGTSVASTSTVFTDGELTQTGEQLDVAIHGNGFFQVLMPDGTLAYTRDGSFKLGPDGRIMTSDGLPIQGGFQPVPDGTTNITISTDGQVTYTGASGTTSFRVQLARFINPSGMQAMGRNLYKQTPASGPPVQGNPADPGFGQLEQGYLEMSNVQVVDEMVKLIMAQRAYEVNSKVVQAADQMLQEGNNLHQG